MLPDLSRRSFLRGTLALAAVAATARYTFALPVIKGDGRHDDTDGLTALFNGEPFVTENEAIVDMVEDGSYIINRGTFYISRTLRFRAGRSGIITESKFRVADDFQGKVILDLEELKSPLYVDGNHFHSGRSNELELAYMSRSLPANIRQVY